MDLIQRPRPCFVKPTLEDAHNESPEALYQELQGLLNSNSPRPSPLAEVARIAVPLLHCTSSLVQYERNHARLEVEYDQSVREYEAAVAALERSSGGGMDGSKAAAAVDAAEAKVQNLHTKLQESVELVNLVRRAFRGGAKLRHSGGQLRAAAGRLSGLERDTIATEEQLQIASPDNKRASRDVQKRVEEPEVVDLVSVTGEEEVENILKEAESGEIEGNASEEEWPQSRQICADIKAAADKLLRKHPDVGRFDPGDEEEPPKYTVGVVVVAEKGKILYAGPTELQKAQYGVRFVYGKHYNGFSMQDALIKKRTRIHNYRVYVWQKPPFAAVTIAGSSGRSGVSKLSSPKVLIMVPFQRNVYSVDVRELEKSLPGCSKVQFAVNYTGRWGTTLLNMEKLCMFMSKAEAREVLAGICCKGKEEEEEKEEREQPVSAAGGALEAEQQQQQESSSVTEVLEADEDMFDIGSSGGLSRSVIAQIPEIIDNLTLVHDGKLGVLLRKRTTKSGENHDDQQAAMEIGVIVVGPGGDEIVYAGLTKLRAAVCGPWLMSKQQRDVDCDFERFEWNLKTEIEENRAADEYKGFCEEKKCKVLVLIPVEVANATSMAALAAAMPREFSPQMHLSFRDAKGGVSRGVQLSEEIVARIVPDARYVEGLCLKKQQQRAKEDAGPAEAVHVGEKRKAEKIEERLCA